MFRRCRRSLHGSASASIQGGGRLSVQGPAFHCAQMLQTGPPAAARLLHVTCDPLPLMLPQRHLRRKCHEHLPSPSCPSRFQPKDIHSPVHCFPVRYEDFLRRRQLVASPCFYSQLPSRFLPGMASCKGASSPNQAQRTRPHLIARGNSYSSLVNYWFVKF